MLGTRFREDERAKRREDEESDLPKKVVLHEDGMPVWRTEFQQLEPLSEKQRSLVDLLHNAAARNDVSVIETVVTKSFINPNLRNAKGWTAIVRAAKMGSAEAVEVLCILRADVNAVTKNGNSALHKAVKKGYVAIAKILIHFKANPNLQNAGGATPLMVGCVHNSSKVKCHCGTTYKDSETFCKKCGAKKDSQDVIDVVLDAKADVNVKKDVGYTALMLASRRGSVRICKKLLLARNERGQQAAKVDIYDKQKETALAKALKKEHYEVASLLKSFGAEEKNSGYRPPGKKNLDHNEERSETPKGKAKKEKKDRSESPEGKKEEIN